MWAQHMSMKTLGNILAGAAASRIGIADVEQIELHIGVGQEEIIESRGGRWPAYCHYLLGCLYAPA